MNIKINGTTCPYCGSPITRPSKMRDQFPGDTYTTSVTYACGTIASENWAPPIRDKNCGRATK